MAKSSKKAPPKPKDKFKWVPPEEHAKRTGKPGAPKGSANAIRHGLRCSALPKDCKHIEIRLNTFRRTLEQAVLDAKKVVTINDAAYIQSALRWERHAALSQRWLTKQYKELKPEQRLLFSREVARASTERDKALALLDLDAPEADRPWLAIDMEPSKDNGDAHN